MSLVSQIEYKKEHQKIMIHLKIEKNMMENYTQDRDEYFKCPTCGKPFSSKIVLKIHMKKEQCLNRQHSQEKSSVIKNVLKKDCVSENAENTVKSAKNENINLNKKIKKEFDQTRTFSTIPQQSKICKEETADINIEKNNEKLKSRHCQECNKTFEKRYFPIHLNVVHNNLRNFQCLQCPKAFGIKKTLQQHFQAIHEKLKPYKCPECDKACSQNSTLRRHIKLVHKKCPPSNVKSCIE